MISVPPIVCRLLLAAALANAWPASAATIYGVLTRGNKPYDRAAVQLTCGQLNSTGQSNERGNYSLSIQASGSCILGVDGKTAPVNLGSQPARYDFEVPAAGTKLVPH